MEINHPSKGEKAMEDTRKKAMRPLNDKLFEVILDGEKIGWLEIAKSGKVRAFLGDGFKGRIGQYGDKTEAAKAIVAAYDQRNALTPALEPVKDAG
jgi:hypothetical protein